MHRSSLYYIGWKAYFGRRRASIHRGCGDDVRNTVRDESPADRDPFIPNLLIRAYKPITPADVNEGKKNWKNTAPVSDGITVANVKRCPDHFLAAFFNILLYHRTTPAT